MNAEQEKILNEMSAFIWDTSPENIREAARPFIDRILAASTPALPGEVEHALKFVEESAENARMWMRQRGIVFDKWPPLDDWKNRELTVEEKWQGVGFSLYTDIVEMAEMARRINELNPTPQASTPSVDVEREAVEWAEKEYPQVRMIFGPQTGESIVRAASNGYLAGASRRRVTDREIELLAEKKYPAHLGDNVRRAAFVNGARAVRDAWKKNR